MLRRYFLLATAAMIVGKWPSQALADKSDLRGFEDVGGPDLETALKKGLLCRRPIEFEFIDLVVDAVAKNKLPVDLVFSTFIWARRKRPYPFVYFRRALRVRAAAQGIDFESKEEGDEPEEAKQFRFFFGD